MSEDEFELKGLPLPIVPSDFVLELTRLNNRLVERTRVVEVTPAGSWCDVPIIYEEKPDDPPRS